MAHPGYGPDGKRLRDVADLSSEDLQREVVGHLVAATFSGATPKEVQREVVRVTAGAQELARRQRRTVEEVFRDLLEQAERERLVLLGAS